MLKMEAEMLKADISMKTLKRLLVPELLKKILTNFMKEYFAVHYNL